MATELVIRAWCDVCLAAGENTPGQTMTVNVRADVAGGPIPAYDVEACSEHAAALVAAVADLAAYGRGVGKGVPKVPDGKKPWEARETAPPPGVCPECGKAAVSLAAMRQHLRAHHGKSLADVGLIPARETCPECGSKYPNSQGLAAHFRMVHPGARKQSA